MVVKDYVRPDGKKIEHGETIYCPRCGKGGKGHSGRAIAGWR